MSGFRRGVRLGIDVGRARVGVARCDPDGLLATPVETVKRDDGAVARVAALAEEYSAAEILVGLPLNLRGEDTAAAARAAFREQFCPWDDGQAADRLARWLLDRL